MSKDGEGWDCPPGLPLGKDLREEAMVQPGQPAQPSRTARSLFPLPFFCMPRQKVGSISCRAAATRKNSEAGGELQ